ncbi:MAG: CvpA family protein [Chloroflexota bacterium]
MTIADIVILAVLALALIGGLRQGFVMEVASILGAVASLAIARIEYPAVRRFLAEFVHHSSWLTVVSYLLVFVVVWGVIILVARRVRWLLRVLKLGLMDRLVGGVVGLLEGILLVELMLYLGRRVPNHQVNHAVNHSVLAPNFVRIIPFLRHLFPYITP